MGEPERGPEPPASELEPGYGELDHTRLAAARLRAAGMQPFLAMALYALTPVADSTKPTFGVDDRWRLHVNPAKLREWTIPQVAGVLLHEVSHVVRDHSGRARTAGAAGDDVTARLWNLAADAEINDDLLWAGVELPENPVTPALLGLPSEKVAEFYYAALVQGEEPPPVEGPDCGSGCHGDGSQADEAMTVPLPPGLSEIEAMLLRRRIAIAVSMTASRQAGLIPGGWVRWAEAIMRPQLDWRRLLAAKIRSCTAAVAGSADYSYSRPPRRRVPKVVLPTLRRPAPRVAIIVDTSGSMEDQQLRSAWTEVHGCLRTLGIRRDMLTVYAADAEVHRVTGPLARKIALIGGGGTDMAAALEHVTERRPRPDLVVVITDGLTGWPKTRPVPAVIVALVPSAVAQPDATAKTTMPDVPPWARVVHIA